jgi:hemerythrin-like domain-containing protein
MTLDMTMMYAMHDALRRELVRVARITERMDDDPRRILRTASGWQMFKTYLRVHHTAEDAALWPVMRQALAERPADLALLEALEAEHATIDPLLATIDATLAHGDSGLQLLGDMVDALRTTLQLHLKHEETEGLRLIDATVSEEQWAQFGVEHGNRIGVERASAYVPWLLDDATAEKSQLILARLPEFARIAYETEWLPPMWHAISGQPMPPPERTDPREYVIN